MKRCEDCIKYKECLKIDCPDYEPKEKPMENKAIFESEEECIKFLNKFYCACTDREQGIKNTFDNIKRSGLAGKSPLEEAEEMYKQHMEIDGHCTKSDDIKRWEENSYKAYSLIKQQHEAIQYLKQKTGENK